MKLAVPQRDTYNAFLLCPDAVGRERDLDHKCIPLAVLNPTQAVYTLQVGIFLDFVTSRLHTYVRYDASPYGTHERKAETYRLHIDYECIHLAALVTNNKGGDIVRVIS